MKSILAVIPLLICTAVHAQALRPPCYALISGPYVGTPKLVKGTEGSHLFWACSAPGKPIAYGFSWRAQDYSLAKAFWIMQLPTRATRREEQANAMWDSNTYDFRLHYKEDSAKGRLSRERHSIYMANRESWGVQ